MPLVTGLFFPVLLLNQRLSAPLRLQASHCITFRIICDVPSVAVFYYYYYYYCCCGTGDLSIADFDVPSALAGDDI